MRRFAARLVRALGVSGAVVGCGAMSAMLPGAAASVLGGLGLAGSSVVGRALSSVSEPLFIISAMLLIIGGLACSWLATLSAGLGGLCLYLSMFVLIQGHSADGAPMAGMGGSGGVHANAPLFWIGSSLILGSLAVSWRRRRQRGCSPVLHVFATPFADT